MVLFNAKMQDIKCLVMIKKADLILLLHHFHRITVFVVVHCKLQYMQNSSALL